MKRRGSLMGSSKYEHDPAGLDRDVNARAAFYRDTVDAMISKLDSPAQITHEFCATVLMKRTDDFLLTLDGVEHYAWNNWERIKL